MTRKICPNCDLFTTCEIHPKRIDGKYPEMECFKPKRNIEVQFDRTMIKGCRWQL